MKKYKLLLVAFLISGFLVRTACGQSVVLKNGPEGIVALVNQDLTVAALAKDPAWTNPNVKGFMVREEWSEVEPTEGTFNFSLFTEAVTLAAKYNKFVGLSIAAGVLSPDWIYTEGATPFYFTPPDGRPAMAMPEPWDPIFLSFWNGLITAFGQQFDGNPNVAYIAMTGPGRDYETYYVTEPVDVADFELMDGEALWGQATVEIAGAFAAAFPHTHLVYNMAPPTPDAAGKATIASAVTTCFQDYPHHFGVECDSLAPTTSPATPSVTFIQAETAQDTVGFQAYLPAAKMAEMQGGGATAESILSESLAKGVLYGGHFVEVYTRDCSTAAQQTNLETGNVGLIANSKASVSP